MTDYVPELTIGGRQLERQFFKFSVKLRNSENRLIVHTLFHSSERCYT